MEKVELWDPSTDLQEWMKNDDWTVIERIDESVSALCLSGFVASGRVEIDLPDHAWRGNEKLVWG
jgi:dihydroneopterin aldolase